MITKKPVKFNQKKFESAKKKVFKTKSPAKTPVYKSGMIGGKPMNYKTAKKGIITSLD